MSARSKEEIAESMRESIDYSGLEKHQCGLYNESEENHNIGAKGKKKNRTSKATSQRAS